MGGGFVDHYRGAVGSQACTFFVYIVASAHILDTDAPRRLQDASKTLQDAQNHPLDAPKSRPRRENGASEHPKTNDFLTFFRLVGKLA